MLIFHQPLATRDNGQQCGIGAGCNNWSSFDAMNNAKPPVQGGRPPLKLCGPGEAPIVPFVCQPPTGPCGTIDTLQALIRSVLSAASEKTFLYFVVPDILSTRTEKKDKRK